MRELLVALLVLSSLAVLLVVGAWFAFLQDPDRCGLAHARRVLDGDPGGPARPLRGGSPPSPERPLLRDPDPSGTLGVLPGIALSLSTCCARLGPWLSAIGRYDPPPDRSI